MRLRVVPKTETITGSLIERTQSFCPNCLSVINTDVIERDGKIYMVKKCCGKTLEYLKEKDLEFYKKIKKYSIKNFIGASWPISELRNKINYLSTIAIHITNKCNTNCAICIADRGEKNFLLDKIWNLRNFNKFLSFIKNKNKIIILSGGEPTARDDLPQIIKAIKDSGNIPYLITNGIKLSDYDYTKKLRDAGLRIIMFSLDSLKKEITDRLRGGDGIFEAKMQALKNIKKCGMKVYLSMTVVSKFNEGEIGDMVNFAARNSDYIAGLIMRPVVPFGRITINTNEDLVISDLIKMAEIQTKRLINKNYLLEFRKFRFNIYKFISNFFGGKYMQDISFNFFLDCFINVKKNKDKIVLEPMIKFRELKKINNIIEEINGKPTIKTWISAYKLINKNIIKFLIVSVISKFNFSKIFFSSFYFKNKIRITFAEVGSPLDADASEKYGYYSIIFNPDNLFYMPTIPYLMSIYSVGDQ